MEGKPGIFYQNIQPIQNPDKLTVMVDKNHQLSSYYVPWDLETIDLPYNPKGLQLRHEARLAFERMGKEAQASGIHLEAVSAYRSYSYQKAIYYKNMLPDMHLWKYQEERDKVSARPGHSEHQTGLAVDINELETSFCDTAEGKWLADQAHSYGFILRYPKGKEKITGYDFEPWHFRYLGRDIADIIYQRGITYDEFYYRYISTDITSVY